jgi:hypothetical protein
VSCINSSTRAIGVPSQPIGYLRPTTPVSIRDQVENEQLDAGLGVVGLLSPSTNDTQPGHRDDDFAANVRTLDSLLDDVGERSSILPTDMVSSYTLNPLPGATWLREYD